MRKMFLLLASVAVLARSSAKFSFDKDGHLLLEAVSGEPVFGHRLVFHKTPGFKPVKPEMLG